MESRIILRGVPVAEDSAGNVCLNDLWRLAGEPPNRRASEWHRSARAKELERAVVDRIMGDSHSTEKNHKISVYYATGRGKKQLTFAHPVLALDYAEFLEPAIGVEVRETFLRFRANAVGLAVEILEKFAAQVEFDAMRDELRRLVAKHNSESAGVAKDAGVHKFEAYNGAGLRGLYGGLTKAEVVKAKGLPKGSHHLDHAGHEELAANYFKATQAVAKLKRENIKGQKSAETAHEQVGEAVRRTIAELGGTMPEDEPALDHIKKARNRLKAADEVKKIDKK
jgi:predicted ArsR family transcriptional regulator